MNSPTSPTSATGRRRPGRPAALLTAAAATALLLAGCGGSPSAGSHHGEGGAEHTSPATSSAPGPTDGSSAQGASAHDDADVAFARDMVVHHVGALGMAQLAVERASTPEVRALAERVVAAQQPEIDLMQGWLSAWGEDGSESQHGDRHAGQHAGQHGSTDTSSTGMSEQDTAALQAAAGTAFDRLFLEQMTVHHRGAVEMAREELASGTDPDARALAQRIEADQTAEISEMAALLAQLSA